MQGLLEKIHKSSFPCTGLLGCAVYQGEQNVAREQSWCRLNSEYHELLCASLNFPSMEQSMCPCGSEPPVAGIGHLAHTTEWQTLSFRLATARVSN